MRFLQIKKDLKGLKWRERLHMPHGCHVFFFASAKCTTTPVTTGKRGALEDRPGSQFADHGAQH